MQCVFVPASAKAPGAVGCCEGVNCAFRVSCLDGSKMDACDESCLADTMTLKWYAMP